MPMATVIEEATPSTGTIVYVPGNHIQEVVNSLDDDMSSLQRLDRNGDYVKLDKAMDVLLDIRVKLTSLI